ncbi:MAG: hypothetical protein AAGD01_01840 [Acidobacteriota bacterium]
MFKQPGAPGSSSSEFSSRFLGPGHCARGVERHGSVLGARLFFGFSSHCLLAALGLGVLVMACGNPTASQDASAPAVLLAELPESFSAGSIAADIEERRKQLPAAPLEADLSALSESDREVVELLIEASRPLDEIFRIQAWSGNPLLEAALSTWEGPQVEAAREYFRIHYGPWDRLDERSPFIGNLEHPKGAGYYPEDLDPEELEAWIAEHPAQAEAMRSLTTLVRRDGAGGLVAVPYSEAFREPLDRSAAKLREAAERTSNDSLRRFLILQADAYNSDNYYDSDMAWMDLDSPVEITIGPYETYEDSLLGYKAAFTSFVTVALLEESAKLDRYKQRLPWLERNLPISDQHKNFERGTESPMRVVDLVFTAGDTRAGVQTIAFNLPNDERVREAKGSKKVLMRNIMKAKYDQILVPIAERTLPADDLGSLSFDAFFNEVLHHELSHGLGPGQITVEGRETEVRLELKELYSTLEEAKADVMGIYNVLALVEEGEMPASLRQELEPTYVAGLFRSARFGLDEAHGRGTVAQFNYLLEKGALVIDDKGRFSVVSEAFPVAMEDLLRTILLLQAEGDYAGTKTFLDTYGVATDELRAAIEGLEGVPVDLAPVYRQAGE